MWNAQASFFIFGRRTDFMALVSCLWIYEYRIPQINFGSIWYHSEPSEVPYYIKTGNILTGLYGCKYAGVSKIQGSKYASWHICYKQANTYYSPDFIGISNKDSRSYQWSPSNKSVSTITTLFKSDTGMWPFSLSGVQIFISWI